MFLIYIFIFSWLCNRVLLSTMCMKAFVLYYLSPLYFSCRCLLL
uniref:Uncharacterized protein n=1 Tax=Rhizophora mucronata TaxID=61149 RepID=A0A2P2N9A1_RHIMU